MPNYPGTLHSTTVTALSATVPPPQALYPGDKSTNLFNAETPTAPQASIAVALGGVYENHPGTVSVEGFWGGDPGAFELDLQTADTDADAFYAQEGLGITTQNDSTAHSFRAEFVNVSATFGRLFIKTRTNAVALTAWIARK